MKKLLIFSLIALIIAITSNTGCVKSNNNTGSTVLTDLPNIAGFAIQAVSTFVPGAAATVSFLAPNLSAGTYTIHFNLTSTNVADNLSNLTATVNLSGTSGTFHTPNIPAAGSVSINITSIENASGGSSSISSNNTKTFFDSTGLMVATYTPAGGSAQPLRATDVMASTTGSTLEIIGTIWTPNLTNITLRDHIYAGSTGTVSFYSTDLNIGTSTSTFNGEAVFQISGSGVLVNQPSAHGTITINTISPLLTGTFSYKNEDSSVVAGSFSCPHP